MTQRYQIGQEVGAKEQFVGRYHALPIGRETFHAVYNICEASLHIVYNAICAVELRVKSLRLVVEVVVVNNRVLHVGV